jgi:hypothetical protein
MQSFQYIQANTKYWSYISKDYFYSRSEEAFRMEARVEAVDPLFQKNYFCCVVIKLSQDVF